MVVVGLGAAQAPPELSRAADDVELGFASWSDLSGAIGAADALFVWNMERQFLAEAWPAAGRLRWIQCASDGVDRLLLPEVVASGITVTNARGVFDGAIAEWVIGTMLAFSARILHQRDAQLRAEWSPITTERLAGKRLLVVGPGPIGRAVGSRALALGMEVGAAGRTARSDALFGQIVPTSDAARLDVALAQAQYVLDALPHTPATAAMFGAERFAAMSRASRFINVGRGDTVDQVALVAALRNGTIAGAALDVYADEPLPSDSALWSMPNVLVSPHMCGDHQAWEADVVSIFLENAGRFARGESLRNLVDTHAGFGIG